MQERADRIIAEQNAKGVAAQEEYARWQASQGGGGASVGGQQATAPPSFDPNQPLPPIRDLLKQSLEYAKDSVGEMFDDRRDVLDPGDADLNKPPPELEDPAQREQWAADERAARDEARAPYLADDDARGRAHALRHHRPHAARGGHRAAERPSTPRASTASTASPTATTSSATTRTRRASSGRSPTRPGPPRRAPRCTLAAFNRADHWAARRFGEPSVLDEDVAGALVARARLEPEDCFGLPRLLQVRATETEDSKFWDAHVEGILAFAAQAARPPPRSSCSPRRRSRSPRRRRSTSRSSTGRRSPRGSRRAATARRARPRRCPHLPSSWEELTDRLPGGRRRPQRGLLRRPGHPRRHQERPRRPLAGELPQQRARRPRAHPRRRARRHRLPRPRGVRGRPRPAGAPTRTRSCTPASTTSPAQRPPLDTEYRPPPSFLSEVFDMFNPLDPMHAFPQVFGRKDRPQLGPYCGRG